MKTTVGHSFTGPRRERASPEAFDMKGVVAEAEEEQHIDADQDHPVLRGQIIGAPAS